MPKIRMKKGSYTVGGSSRSYPSLRAAKRASKRIYAKRGSKRR